MKQTKEQLLIEVIKLRESHAHWVSGDESRRLEFAKAFNWFKSHSGYGDERLPMIRSWPQVFIEIGKLLAIRDFRKLEGNVSELECKLEDLENRIKKEIHPNL